MCRKSLPVRDQRASARWERPEEGTHALARVIGLGRWLARGAPRWWKAKAGRQRRAHPVPVQGRRPAAAQAAAGRRRPAGVTGSTAARQAGGAPRGSKGQGRRRREVAVERIGSRSRPGRRSPASAGKPARPAPATTAEAGKAQQATRRPTPARAPARPCRNREIGTAPRVESPARFGVVAIEARAAALLHGRAAGPRYLGAQARR